MRYRGLASQYLVRVIVDVGQDPVQVITVYRSSKISKDGQRMTIRLAALERGSSGAIGATAATPA